MSSLSRAASTVHVAACLPAGNATLRALGVPLLHELLFESARAVPNPDPAEVAAGRATVYDTWLLNRLDNATGRPQ